jgi:hypothetical protein
VKAAVITVENDFDVSVNTTEVRFQNGCGWMTMDMDEFCIFNVNALRIDNCVKGLFEFGHTCNISMRIAHTELFVLNTWPIPKARCQ